MMKLTPLVTVFSLIFVTLGGISAVIASEQEDEKPCHEQSKPRFKKPRFADLDLNQDSFVTLEEFKQKEIPHGDHDTVFGHIDVDGNGEITEQEFNSHRPPRRPPHGRQSGDQERSAKQTSKY